MKLAFLEDIKSRNDKSKNKYKRVSVSPLRYAGGKSLAVGHITELVPANTKRIVSPFFGGGSFELALNKYLDMEIIGYDIFKILVNYWQIQIKYPEILAEKLEKLDHTKTAYNEIKEKLKRYWNRENKLNNLMLASYYFHNHNLSYGPMFLGWYSSNYEIKKKYDTMIDKVRKFKVKNVSVECLSFEKTLAKHRKDFLYLDPPYYLEDGLMWKAMYPNCNFPVHHKNFDHALLRDLLKKHEGGFVLSYNNCSTIRKWYDDFNFSFPEWQYTYGQGEKRIGKNRLNGNKTNIKESHEILIYK